MNTRINQGKSMYYAMLRDNDLRLTIFAIPKPNPAAPQ